ncbi:MAG TPA: DUF3885 domain-containing protein [Pseudoneobacillus sp.]|nr:DUF3885 domain-containing protein [Pseudoneobacillus sp.]
MNLTKYLNEKFPKLSLSPPLFYKWHTGIRFELGNPKENDEVTYMDGVYQRSLTIFKQLHRPIDDMFIVANVNHDSFENRKLKIFNHNIKNKSVLYRLQHEVVPNDFEDEFDIHEIETHRYSITCKTSDIKYSHLIKAICNQDMGIKPKIKDDVFFINTTNDTILHIYDDRGCDVITRNKESIRPLYKQFHDWILNHDRVAIDKIFEENKGES